MTLTPFRLEVLRCLNDNNGTMTFADISFDLSPYTSKQGLGRILSNLARLGLVDRYRNWDNEESVSLTRQGETLLADYEKQLTTHAKQITAEAPAVHGVPSNG